MDTAYTDKVTCPHCGHVHNDSWEYNDENGCDFFCGKCGGEFTVWVNVTVTYTTKKTGNESGNVAEEE